MKTAIRRFARWLLALCGDPIVPVPASIIDHDLIAFTRKLCDRQDAKDAEARTSGEWKRDRVYEQLLNTFPNVRPKHLHLAILLARM